ncbi:hypothetical protein [Blattabacterium cuenoti]|uniref:hypothetical protein n=1 Tax=Blattabacterium cuenoti TaxID=1653831 RepID=UPI001EEC9BC9|nr:hypothetical protein [Blattabacterium cuenoti]
MKKKLFNIINFYYEDPLDDASSTKSKVYRQEPTPGKRQDKNQPINLWLTTKPLDGLTSEFKKNDSKNEEKIPKNEEMDEKKTKKKSIEK